ncbi:MAG: hypothetical protein LBR34_01500 [Prevotella sp.]|nr:hypothetical protein [Prevotella sp.]
MNILHYIAGLSSGKEARRTEIEAMRDPFLAEALEGYDSVAGDHIARITALQKRVEARTTRRRSAYWLAAACSAAAAVLLAVYLLTGDKPVGNYADSGDLFVYLPENYRAKAIARNSGYSVREITPAATISNLEELFVPDEPIDIYLPGTYSAEQGHAVAPKVDITEVLE